MEKNERKNKKQNENLIISVNVAYAALFVLFVLFVPMYRVNRSGAKFGIKVLNIKSAFAFFVNLFSVVSIVGSKVGLFFGITYVIPISIVLTFAVASIVAVISIGKICVETRKSEYASTLGRVGRMANWIGVALFGSLQFAFLEGYKVLASTYILAIGYIAVLVLNNRFVCLRMDREEYRKPLLRQTVFHIVEFVLSLCIPLFAKSLLLKVSSFALIFAGKLGNWVLIAIATIILSLFPLFILLGGLWHLNLNMLSAIRSENEAKVAISLKQSGTDLSTVAEPRKPVWNIIFAVLIIGSLIILKMVTDKYDVYMSNHGLGLGEKTSIELAKALQILKIKNADLIELYDKLKIDASVLNELSFFATVEDAQHISLGLKTGWFGVADGKIIALMVNVFVWSIVSVMRSSNTLGVETQNEIGTYLYKKFEE